MVFVRQERVDFSEELAKIRIELGWTIRQFAKQLKLTESRYKNWEYGRVKKIPENVVERARLLLENRGNAIVQQTKVTSFAVTFAIRAWRGVLAGNSLDAEATYEREEEAIEVPSAFLIGGFERIEFHEVIRVSGNSMAPRIYSGERVIVYLDSVPRTNSIVFVESPEGKLFLKCLRESGKGFALESYAPDGLSVDNLGGWKIHGYAIAVLGDPGLESRNIEWNEGRPLRA